MDPSGGSSRSTGIQRRIAHGPRRFWTPEEDLALADALKSLRAQGWRCDGSFKGRYMSQLEKILEQSCPNSGILVKHIKSKLQVWKRTYSHIVGILGCSGGAGATMDATTHMIVAETDAVWDEYCKVNPEASKLKGRAFPLYNSWVEIFGNDRAQGTGAVDVGDVVHELLNGLKSKDLEKSSGSFPSTPSSTPLPEADETFDESVSTTPPLAPKQQPISRVCTKRKQCNMITVDIEALVGKWMDNTSSALGNLAKELAQPKSVQSTPSAEGVSAESCLFDAICKIPDLSLDEQIQASHHLTHNEADLRLFWGMHEQARARFIRMLLSGHLNSR